jgi:hypothetical protein
MSVVALTLLRVRLSAWGRFFNLPDERQVTNLPHFRVGRIRHAERDDYSHSFTHRFLSKPIPSISTSTTSPGFK